MATQPVAQTAVPDSKIFSAGDLQVTHVDSKQTVPLSSFYQGKPVVLVFLRRWGCALCRGYAKQLNTHIVPLLQANNVGIKGVGVEWFGIDEFKSLNVFPSEHLYVDDGKHAYKKLGLSSLSTFRGLADVFSYSARTYRDFVKNKLGISGNLKGDGFQLGATYVLGPNGEIWLEHKQKDYGDHPSLRDIVKALKNHMPEFNENPPNVAPLKEEDDIPTATVCKM